MERTIYAVSTPPGRGGIGVVRLSGPLTKEILHRVFPGKTFPPRRMVYGRLTDGAGRLPVSYTHLFCGSYRFKMAWRWARALLY